VADDPHLHNISQARGGLYVATFDGNPTEDAGSPPGCRDGGGYRL